MWGWFNKPPISGIVRVSSYHPEKWVDLGDDLWHWFYHIPNVKDFHKLWGCYPNKMVKLPTHEIPAGLKMEVYLNGYFIMGEWFFIPWIWLFLKLGYPQSSSIYRWIFHYKPSILGYPPFMETSIYIYTNDFRGFFTNVCTCRLADILCTALAPFDCSWVLINRWRCFAGSEPESWGNKQWKYGCKSPESGI